MFVESQGPEISIQLFQALEADLQIQPYKPATQTLLTSRGALLSMTGAISCRGMPQGHAFCRGPIWRYEAYPLSPAALSNEFYGNPQAHHQRVAELMQENVARRMLQGPQLWRWQLEVAARLRQLAQLQKVCTGDTSKQLLSPA